MILGKNGFYENLLKNPRSMKYLFVYDANELILVFFLHMSLEKGLAGNQTINVC